MIDRYAADQTWQWNVDHAPSVGVRRNPTAVPGTWRWCGLPTASPLGIPAGPLLNSAWLLYYANLGFDILVYKTVRSRVRDCYPIPNLVPVEVGQFSTAGAVLQATSAPSKTWAVSFGMPSQLPDVWRQDVQTAREGLSNGQVLVVSVVGTQDESVTDPEASLEQLADDFARCAAWAADSGAHGVEANFSCPNVCTADGQLFQHPEHAGFVAERIRSRIGSTPLVLKIGRVTETADAERLLHSVGPFINGIAVTNSIAARVQADSGELLFDGQPRGICGDAIREACLDQVRLFRQVIDRRAASAGHPRPDLIGVGGISTADHVRDYLTAGADSVGLATAVMQNPEVGLQIRSALGNA
ncbi:MAG: hypothetical protein KDA89_24260 [Planctomycetaceae bacterium]|nr:hypothetical protein [Planctomycetaceae bacterium]